MRVAAEVKTEALCPLPSFRLCQKYHSFLPSKNKENYNIKNENYKRNENDVSLSALARQPVILRLDRRSSHIEKDGAVQKEMGSPNNIKNASLFEVC